MWLGAVHSLHQGAGLVGCSHRGLQEAVHVDVVHLYDPWGTVRAVPANQNTLVQLSLQGELLGRGHRALPVIEIVGVVIILNIRLRSGQAQVPDGCVFKMTGMKCYSWRFSPVDNSI